MTRVDRFWKRVLKTDNCWEWQGARFAKGYGRTSLNGKHILAHRMAWFLTAGSHAEGLVLHKCDNRACVRPDHLFVGTHQDNMDDMMSKGRQKFTNKHSGEGNPRSILKQDQIQAIRTRFAAGETAAALAVEYGVSKRTIHKITSGERWGRVRAL